VVGDEFKVFEVDVLIWSGLDAEPDDVADGDCGLTWMMESLEHLEEKHAANPPFWCTNYQCFFAPVRNRVVKIACSSSEVVLRITEHTMIYPSSVPT
jgi:hypothetical protein